MKKLLAFTLLLLPVPTFAQLQNQTTPEKSQMRGSPKTAKELKDACTATGKESPRQLYCVGYVEASVWLSLLPTADGDGTRIVAELPEGYTFEQFIKAFLVYLDQHPEEEQHPAQGVLLQAWVDHKMLILKTKPCQELRPR